MNRGKQGQCGAVRKTKAEKNTSERITYVEGIEDVCPSGISHNE